MKISNKGLAGEFYVLAQLNARGYDASLTLGNTKGVDILVMNNDKNIGFKVLGLRIYNERARAGTVGP